VFQLTRRSLDLHLAASLKAPFDLLAQARIVAVDEVDAAIAQPAPTASRHAAATAKTGTRARPSTLFMLTSSVDEANGLPLACLLPASSAARLDGRTSPTTRDYADVVTSSRRRGISEKGISGGLFPTLERPTVPGNLLLALAKVRPPFKNQKGR
jgi:hypothetical protein